MARWQANRTLLLVGEGDTEEAFLRHVKGIYAPRGCGLVVQVKNARGKGAKHVIDWTSRQLGIAQYDLVAALLDTDTDWSEAVAKKAKSAGIMVLKSEPCFESMMLRVLGQNIVADARTLKARFAPFVRNNALDARSYEDYFGRDSLEAGRGEPSINALLTLFAPPQTGKNR